jgi:putative heme-binding domain-containing protein
MMHDRSGPRAAGVSRRAATAALVVCGILAGVAVGAARPAASGRPVEPAVAPPGVIHPFNGTTLEGWSGDLAHWSVEEGQIVGRTTAERPLAESAYLVWEGAMPQDFDLRCRVRIAGKGANSGIQYRSARVPGQADLRGPQADLDVENRYTGALYEGLGRGLMSARGEQVEWGPGGKRVLAQFAPDAALRKAIRADDWNEYRIEARGTRMRHWINGVLMSDVTDGDATRFRRAGLLALQLHKGPPMEVRFADLEVRALTEAPPPGAITVPEGFTVELLASAQPGQGTWVCLAFDPLGRAVISPQSGPLLQAWIPGVSRVSAQEAWTGRDAEVRPLGAPVGSAQGLCFAHGALFVNVAQEGGQYGLWRLRDTAGDGTWKDATRLVTYGGQGGEHGPHGVVAGPDGALYVAIGNHTVLPEAIARPATDTEPGAAPGSPYDHFAEDLAGPRMWDPRGHAVGIRAPGGVVLRVDPETGAATIFAGGFRNAYDHCFTAAGELFTYDSDMEWDIGAPWYRAPRVVHVVQGGEYGWRSGSGCWPDWYPDSLPPACETDSASPTGMVSGHEGAWPEPWRSMLFCADWTYGRILAVSLAREGATWSGAWSVFATGRPMPVADLAWGPDGQMYLVTGGRGTQSGLYRISFTGAPAGSVGGGGHEASSGAAGSMAPDDAMDDPAETLGAMQTAARRVCEAMQEPMPAAEFAEAAEVLWACLASDDRWLRSAARTALEHQPVEAWRAAALAQERDVARMEGALALVRAGGVEDARAACRAAAAEIDRIAAHAPEDAAERRACLLGAVRVLQVALARHPALRADADLARGASAALACTAGDPDGPVAWAALELACHLEMGAAVAPAMERMARATDRASALRYATMLRTVRNGWTDELRARYWAWLNAANDAAGGFSLGGFLAQVRADARGAVGGEALAGGTDPAGAHGGGAGSSVPGAAALSPPAPRATGAAVHEWTVEELLQPTDADGPPDLQRGARVFQEASCILCHRFAGVGSSTGPDLTGVGARFTRADLLRAILLPSAEVSDQYRDSVIETRDGSIVVGRIVSDGPDAIEVRTNPLGEERERVARAEILSIAPVETSAMPPGLLNARTRAEVLDLLAYLERGVPAPGRVVPSAP